MKQELRGFSGLQQDFQGPRGFAPRRFSGQIRPCALFRWYGGGKHVEIIRRSGRFFVEWENLRNVRYWAMHRIFTVAERDS